MRALPKSFIHSYFPQNIASLSPLEEHSSNAQFTWSSPPIHPPCIVFHRDQSESDPRMGAIQSPQANPVTQESRPGGHKPEQPEFLRFPPRCLPGRRYHAVKTHLLRPERRRWFLFLSLFKLGSCHRPGKRVRRAVFSNLEYDSARPGPHVVSDFRTGGGS
jgi:hypothetical protein